MANCHPVGKHPGSISSDVIRPKSPKPVSGEKPISRRERWSERARSSSILDGNASSAVPLGQKYRLISQVAAIWIVYLIEKCLKGCLDPGWR